MTQPREIRFFFDWGHWWPLWESGTEKYAMEPDDYDLSAELTSLLRHLYDHWHQHVDPVAGWDSEENLQLFIRERDEAIHLLREELPADITLVTK